MSHYPIITVTNLTDGGGINPIAIIVAPIVALALLTAAAAIALAPVLVNVNVGVTIGRQGWTKSRFHNFSDKITGSQKK